MRELKSKDPRHYFINVRPGPWIKLSLLSFLLASMAAADYVGTAVNRILLDPQSLVVVADGFQVNDEISYILETTPADTGSTVGTGAWATAYVPNGVVVVNAELVIASAGSYIKIPAKDVGPMAEDCGNRGCDNWTEVAGSFEDAPLGPGQQDTGIFYSTDPRTVQLASPLAAIPSGSGAQGIWNQWDFDQVVAFGMKKNFNALWPLINPGNDGKGNTALVSTDSGVSWKGTGSPVAGPATFFTNDYDPDCDISSTALVDDSQCEGPWQRIKYDNAKIGGLAGGAALAPPTTGTSVLVNNSVLTTAGHDFASDGALPAGTNAVRFVHGIRRLGDIEYARVTFRIVDAAAFAQSVFVDQDFCLDGTGSDTDKPGRGAQDNIYRYYEGNPHSCYTGSSDANFAKLGRYVNGVSSPGANLAPDDIISYELLFTNTSADTLYDISFTDTASLNLDLVAPGVPGCSYTSYDSVPAGASFNGAGLPGSASWGAFPSLASGSSVSVFVCAKVDGGLALGDQVKNDAMASYKLTAAGSPEAPLVSTTLGTVSSQIAGAVYSDLDASGTLTPGDIGLGGVTVELWDDSTGSTAGELDGTDSLLRTSASASDGTYEFNGFFGDLIVVASDPAGYNSTGDADSGAVCGAGNGCNVIGRIVLADDEKSVANDFFDFTPPSSDLSLVNTVSNPTADVGSTVTFTVAVTNDGPSTATNISVTDILPNGFTYTASSMTGGDSRNETGSPTLVWGINSLATSATATLTFQAAVKASGTYANLAQVTGSDQGDIDSTPGNDDGDQSEDDEDSAAVSPTPVVDLSLVNTVDNPTAPVGSTVTFTLVLSNAGPSTATNIGITDVLPNGFTYAANSMTGGDSRNEAGAPTLVWGVDSLAGASSVTLTFQATVNASGSYVNVAQVTASDQGDSDSTSGNDDGNQPEDDEDAAIVVPPGAGTTGGGNSNAIATSANAIPTLGEWGFALLAILMAGLAVITRRLT